MQHRGPEYWTADKSINTCFFRKGDAFIGCIGDLGVHKIDVIRWIVDDEVDEVQAALATLDKKDMDGQPITVENNAMAILKFKNGVIGTLTTSWTYYGDEDHSTVIFGTEGILKIYDNPDYPVTITKKSGEKVFYEVGKIPTNEVQIKTGIIDKFVDCIV